MHADRFGEVAIARRITRHQPAEPRKHAEGVRVVERLQCGQAWLRELEHEQLPPWLEYAVHRGERCGLVGDVAQAKADGDAIEALVGKRQALRVRLNEGDVADDAG